MFSFNCQIFSGHLEYILVNIYIHIFLIKAPSASLESFFQGEGQELCAYLTFVNLLDGDGIICIIDQIISRLLELGDAHLGIYIVLKFIVIPVQMVRGDIEQ